MPNWRPTSGEALTGLLPSMCGQAGEMAFLAPTQKSASGALPCLGFHFFFILFFCKEGPVARRLKVELGEGKKRVYPQAVVTGQPPSVPSWDSTLFQSSGLRAGAPVLILEGGAF